MGRAAGSLITKIIAVAWILLCVHVARSLPANAGERIGRQESSWKRPLSVAGIRL